MPIETWNAVCEFAAPFTSWLNRNSQALVGGGAFLGITKGLWDAARARSAKAAAQQPPPAPPLAEGEVPLVVAPREGPNSARLARLKLRSARRWGRVFLAAGLVLLSVWVVRHLEVWSGATPTGGAPTPPAANPLAAPPAPTAASPHPPGFAFAPLAPRSPVEIALTEVTQAQFRQARVPGHVAHFSGAGKGSRAVAGLATPDDFPVDASARQAEAFCAYLATQSPGRAYRLPTLAEFRSLAAAHPAPTSVSGLVLSRSKFDARTRPEPVGLPTAGEFRHLYGNVAELVTTPGGYAAVGGGYLDTMGGWLDAAGAIKPVAYGPNDQRSDVGFRVVCETAVR